MSSPSDARVEDAKREAGVVHQLMQRLEQEVKVFEGGKVYLPLDEVKRSLGHGDEGGEMIQREIVNVSLALAAEYDKIRCAHETRGAAEGAGDLRGVLASTVALTSRWCAYRVSNVAQTPNVVSNDDYGLVYDVIEADFPMVHEWMDVALCPTGYLNMFQDLDQFQFDAGQRSLFKFAYGILSRVEELLASLMNCAGGLDETLAVLYQKYVAPTNAAAGREEPPETKQVQNTLSNITRIQESILGDVPYLGSATQGELMGLIALKVTSYATCWLMTELHLRTVVLSKDGREGPPVLSSLQSAGVITHIVHISNKVRMQDLLVRTGDAGKYRQEGDPNEATGSSRGMIGA
ncbi:hypothetical protein HOP50_02g12330 [Chloropicon primus]|nr:hypothetical protein HOP50_02g12330 [Chloropicon primus]